MEMQRLEITVDSNRMEVTDRQSGRIILSVGAAPLPYQSVHDALRQVIVGVFETWWHAAIHDEGSRR